MSGKQTATDYNLQKVEINMAIKNVKVSMLEPSYVAMSKAGLTPRLPKELTEAYGVLWNQLTGKDYDPSTHPVLMSFNGSRLYLPKVYQQDGKPVLLWGSERIELSELPESVQITWANGDTGYAGAHAIILWTPDKKLKGAKDIYQTQFPLATIKGDTVTADFISLVGVSESEAFESFIMRPNPTMGLDWLDEEIEVDKGDSVKVTVVNAVTMPGSEQYGGGTYTTAVVRYPAENGELYKVRTNGDMKATLSASLVKFPLSAEGVVKKGRSKLNLCDVTLTEDDLDLSKA